MPQPVDFRGALFGGRKPAQFVDVALERIDRALPLPFFFARAYLPSDLAPLFSLLWRLVLFELRVPRAFLPSAPACARDAGEAAPEVFPVSSLHNRHGIGSADFAHALHQFPVRAHGARRFQRRLRAIVLHQFKRHAASPRPARKQLAQPVENAASSAFKSTRTRSRLGGLSVT